MPRHLPQLLFLQARRAMKKKRPQCPRCNGRRIGVEKGSRWPYRCLDCWHRWAKLSVLPIADHDDPAAASGEGA